MALLNGVYIHVVKEDFKSNADLLSHPAETGIKVTDHVQRSPYELSLSGVIPGENSLLIAEAFMSQQEKGEFVVYSGRHYFDNALIQNFTKSADFKDIEGFAFSMTIREIRLVGQVKSAKVGNKSTASSTNAGRQTSSPGKTSSPEIHSTKKGDTGQSISAQYGISFAKLENLNPQLAGRWDSLPVGESIKVR